MKRLLVGMIAAAVFSVLILAGCSSRNGDDPGRQGTSDRPWGNRQFTMADLMGEVDTINGNDITLKIIEMPSFNRNRGEGGGNGENGDRRNRRNVTPPKGNPPNGNPPGGNMNGSGQNGNQNGDSQDGTQNNDRQRPGRGRNYTGETKTITITSDIPVSKMVRGENGMEEQKLEIKDIKKGDTLSVYYSDKDKSKISRITVSSLGGGWNNRVNGSDTASDT